MDTFEVTMDFGDKEPAILIVDALDHSQAIFIASTMLGAVEVVSQIMLGNMHIDVRPLAASSFEDSWPHVTVETVTQHETTAE